MEKDPLLKHILEQSTEGAGTLFEAGVMSRIASLPEGKLHIEPLVPPRLKRAFVWTAGVLSAAIFLLCAVIAAPYLGVRWQIPEAALSGDDGMALFQFILTFWVVFGVNALIQKRAGRNAA